MASKDPDQMTLWSQLLEDGSVPLVKILTLGDMTGEFQFSHLSFQEALFVRALARSGRPFPSFWGSDSALNTSLNDAFYRNTFVIGRGFLGEALASKRPALSFDCQPRLSELGREGFRNLAAGTCSLRRLNLANVNLGDGQEVEALVAAVPGLPQLEELVLTRCRLSAVKPMARLLRSCPLRLLDLEGNRHFLKTSADASELQQEVGAEGLGQLEMLSLRWCHIPPAAGASVKEFLKLCCPALQHLDLQGNRGLPRALLEDAFPSSCLYGC
ncbi:unnamed protein product [Symbiodinium pilosum]|uniref:Uncharacterized protein n=1 Tax=Symbiodinium pilosum TaxID=2952 RepID=A0A812UL94_SYMPI|nr:unnamed protein product [Symbiodinium pilosum]